MGQERRIEPACAARAIYKVALRMHAGMFANDRRHCARPPRNLCRGLLWKLGAEDDESLGRSPQKSQPEMVVHHSPRKAWLFLLSLGCLFFVDCFELRKKFLCRHHWADFRVLLQVCSRKLLALDRVDLPQACVLGHLQNRNIDFLLSRHG